MTTPLTPNPILKLLRGPQPPVISLAYKRQYHSGDAKGFKSTVPGTRHKDQMFTFYYTTESYLIHRPASYEVFPFISTKYSKLSGWKQPQFYYFSGLWVLTLAQLVSSSVLLLLSLGVSCGCSRKVEEGLTHMPGSSEGTAERLEPLFLYGLSTWLAFLYGNGSKSKHSKWAHSSAQGFTKPLPC